MISPQPEAQITAVKVPAGKATEACSMRKREEEVVPGTTKDSCRVSIIGTNHLYQTAMLPLDSKHSKKSAFAAGVGIDDAPCANFEFQLVALTFVKCGLAYTVGN